MGFSIGMTRNKVEETQENAVLLEDNENSLMYGLDEFNGFEAESITFSSANRKREFQNISIKFGENIDNDSIFLFMCDTYGMPDESYSKSKLRDYWHIWFDKGGNYFVLHLVAIGSKDSATLNYQSSSQLEGVYKLLKNYDKVEMVYYNPNS